MEKQIDSTKTLGQAIDEVIQSLIPLDEPSRMTAIKAACDHLKIQFSGVQQHESLFPQALGTALPTTTAPTRIVDIKSFKQEKQPSSANEMAAIVAFYLSELGPQGEKKQEVKVADMLKYFKQAGFPLPRAPQVLLANAKNAGYFDGGKDGLYKLNPVGYNLVAYNLPRANSGSLVTKRKRKPKALPKKTSHKHRK